MCLCGMLVLASYKPEQTEESAVHPPMASPSLIPASLLLCRLQNVAATSLPREAVLQLVSCSGNLFVMFMQSVLSGFFSLLCCFFFLHSLLLDLIVILPS